MPPRVRRWIQGWVARPLRGLLHILFVAPISWLFLYAFYCTLYSFTGAAAVTLGAWVGARWLHAAQNKQRRRALALLAAVMVGSLTFGLIGSYFNPQPLPVTSLRTTDGHVVRGRLVIHVDRYWYLAIRPNHVESVPDARVRSAVTASQPHRKPRTGWEEIRSRL